MAGRPKGESDVRERLIDAARQLFTDIPYEKVSTRMLADHADVNIAMIRYYFGNKNGLFVAMLKEVTSPIREQMEVMLEDASSSNVTAILTRFYQIMAENPALPILIYRVMTMPEESEPRKNLMSYQGQRGGYPQKIFKALEAGSGLQPGVDPMMAWLSVHSLMVFPFLIQPIAKIQGVDLTGPEFLERLAEHNSSLLTRGLFKEED
ncbi:MAG: TetR/AcrR family transcriptional regulator [Endozoicomonas sp.]